MKRFLIPITSLFLMGCYTVRVNVNMPESEFTQKYKSAAMVEMSDQRDVYSMVLFSGGQYVTKYFYFVNQRLVKVDEGRQPDMVIQNNY